MAILDDIYSTTVKGAYKEIQPLIQQALNENIEINDIINKTLLKVIVYVGDKFSTGELYMSDMLLSAKTMKAAMEILKPHMKKENHISEKGTIIIGTVKGDLHDIGKNLVIIMAEGQGFKVIDIGIHVDYPVFLEAIKKNNPDIVAFSGFLTTTIANIPNYVKVITDTGLCDKVILTVGGAPVTQHFTDIYNIEIYAPDASSAVKGFIKAVEVKKDKN